MTMTKEEREAAELRAFRNCVLLLITYSLGALMTNAYCRSYRWSDWAQSQSSEAPYAMTFFTTAGWPVYWAARGATFVVELPKNARVVWPERETAQ